MKTRDTPTPPESTLLVGLGSLCGDDSVGLCVARQLAEHDLPGVRIRLAYSPTQLFDWFDGLQHLIVCDACVTTGPVGRLQRWTWPSDEVEHLRFSGSHDMSLPTVLAIAEQLEQLPATVTIWGVAIMADRATLPSGVSSALLAPLESSDPASAAELQQMLSEPIFSAMPTIVAQIYRTITA